MVDVVLNQRAFGLQDGFLHSMKLLCDVDAGLLVFNHVDDASGPTSTETASMKRQVMGYLRVVLTIALAVGVFLSSNSRMISHDVTELAKIAVEHHTEVEKHDHAHEDYIDVMHADHGYAHDVADHDHNIAFLPPRASSGILPPTRANWALAGNAMPDRRDFDLDRPPRA